MAANGTSTSKRSHINSYEATVQVKTVAGTDNFNTLVLFEFGQL